MCMYMGIPSKIINVSYEIGCKGSFGKISSNLRH